MRWLALLPTPAPDAAAAPPALDATEALLQSTAWLGLQFSPRVARLEEAIVLEVEASLRLFGGPARLLERLHASAAAAGLALQVSAWSASAHAALARLRAGAPAATPLDALPLHTVSAVAAQQPMLERLGCRRLGDVRGLPRAALARRFGPALLQGLDRAYAEQPEAHRWLSLPERFEARLELPLRVEQAPALHGHAEVLLRELCAWLAARRAGVQDFTLAWQHDAMRPRDAGRGGQLQLHTAAATRDFAHLTRLLGEHLGQTRLDAPAGELRLAAGAVSLLPDQGDSLLAEARDGRPREALGLLLERLAVRLGPARVRSARLVEDHRLDAMQVWAAGTAAGERRLAPAAGPAPPGPQPAWRLDPPLRLAAPNEQPQHQGPLLRIAGPHRLESGWWDGAGQQRDYYLFYGPHCGLLWIFHERPAGAAPGWFLHGVFG
ncbi:MAG: DNA polymerase Y family protein [Pelomonas sp.]|nr:DNA polymerase Y family protein [Roseateles sp.]